MNNIESLEKENKISSAGNNQMKSMEEILSESIERLECLFKSYQKDSEFNYQLTVSNSPFAIIKNFIELDKWQPIANYFKKPKQYDWVLVQFKEKDTDFKPIPRIADYREYDDNSEYKTGWYLIGDDEKSWKYFNEDSEAIAFRCIDVWHEKF